MTTSICRSIEVGMRTLWLWLCVALLAMPAAATAQHQRAQPSRGVKGAVEKLFEHRVELELSTDQLFRLQEITDQAEQQNRPIQQEMMTVWREWKSRRAAEPDMPDADREALHQRTVGEVRRLQEQIERNEHAAMAEVGKVLTPEQKTMVREMVDRSRGGKGRSGDRERGQRRE
jgi:hypothetical protein